MIGLLAGALTTLSFMPQLIRIWRRRSASDISYAALLTFIVGISMWLIYGVLLESLPIMLANGVTLGLNLWILTLKIQHRD